LLESACAVDNVVEKAKRKVDDEEELFDEAAPFDLDADEHPIGLDDETANDLNVGVQIQETNELIADGEQGTDWDMAELFNAREESGQENDDRTGPDEFDPSTGIEEIRSENLDDTSLGFDEPDTLIAPDLPDLNERDGDQVLFDDRELELPNEGVIEDAAARWRWQLVASGRYEALSSGLGAVIAVGDDLLWIEGPPQKLEMPGALCDLQVAVEEPLYLVTASKSGRVFLLKAPEHHLVAPALFELYRAGLTPSLGAWPSPREGLEVVMSTAGGQLFALNVQARRFEPVELPGVVVKLPTRSDHPLVLSRDAGSLCLLGAESVRGPWRKAPLDARLAQSLGLGPFQIATWGGYSVCAGPRLGLLCTDARGSFQRVPGCVAVSALTAGDFEGRPSFWLALSHEISNRTDFVLLDGESRRALRLADCETLLDGEFSPVLSLTWNAVRRQLFAAGEFGVLSLSPR
jgi:hypothetical protein